MKKALLFILILFFCGNTIAQKKDHQDFIESIRANELKSLSAGCQLGVTVTEISLNNVRTFLHTDGIIWYNPESSQVGGYEIPRGSGKTSIYSGSLWIAGSDKFGSVRASGIKFKGARNFWPGPLVTSGESSGTTNYETCYQYDRHFTISKTEVAKFRSWFKATDSERQNDFKGYSIPDAIYEWPAHGEASAGYDFYLAPFYDNNDDGTYNPLDGDYPFFDLDGIFPCKISRENEKPRLYGDQTTWWVYNDMGNIHNSPQGDGIGLEIRAQAFQFSTNDELNDMSFIKFELINRSNNTLYDAFVGLYTDGDIGYMGDDFAGCDVTRGMGYYYNGKEVDSLVGDNSYGANPPAVGFDFLEGPFKDPNGIDDCSSYDQNNNLICNECILNGNINGLNFGDGIADNERLGMTGFSTYPAPVWYDPYADRAVSIYNLVRGIWNDGSHMRYGANGHYSYTSGPETNYMFPGTSDPCGFGQKGQKMEEWTELTAGNLPGDRRAVQSSGPFTMEPGSVNDVTIGVVWARSYEGGMFSSLDKMLRADDKAQALFDNCFRLTDGPDAPELTIIEQDRKLIFNIWNKPGSNNYLERYDESDPFIVCPDNNPDCDNHYKFQGYQVWQLNDHTVTLKDAVDGNPEKARLIFQCDIRDGIGRLVNHEWDHRMQTNIPKIEVEGADQGIRHSFVVEEDIFAKGAGRLINFIDYYYVAVAYAHNNYLQYDQNSPENLQGQKKPYKAGRKGADGPVKIYKAIPHNTSVDNPDLRTEAAYGVSPPITQVEGHGSGLNLLEMTRESRDDIMSGPPWKVENVKYLSGRGPVDVKVVDPNNFVSDLYTLKFDSVNYFQGAIMNGEIVDAGWYVYNTKGDTVYSESRISREYEQLLIEWGLSIIINQEEVPFQTGSANNGFLAASMKFEDPSRPWLSFVADDDRAGPRNWIRSGYTSGDYGGDPEAVYESILDGTWAPYRQAFIGRNGLSNDKARAAINTGKQRLAPVDIYFTPDRSKWTRSPVVETTDDEELSIGNVQKFYLRAGQSIDKWGVPAAMGAGIDTINEQAANYISETGMGWFPGYAIDVATGERLNIVYGESSWLTGDNGADMMWNPSSREGSKIYIAKEGIDVDPLEVYFGGKHFIYIMGHNQNMRIDRDEDYMPAYDAGKFFMDNIKGRNSNRLRVLFKNAMWCAIPLINPDCFDEDDIEDDPYGFVKNELKISIRVVDQYYVDVYDRAKPEGQTLNNNMPMYTFNTGDLTVICPPIRSTDLLEMINVVPNPYYGISGYANPQHELGVKIINLPKECTISIFTLSGNMVRRIIKNESPTWIHWDLNNQYGKPVASGIYIIHIDIPAVGEKVLKWMGAID